MRKVISISLPESLAKEVEKEVKAGKFAGKSEFFRNLFRVWKEEKPLKELKESRMEIAEGKGKTLRSLKSLR